MRYKRKKIGNRDEEDEEDEEGAKEKPKQDLPDLGGYEKTKEVEELVAGELVEIDGYFFLPFFILLLLLVANYSLLLLMKRECGCLSQAD